MKKNDQMEKKHDLQRTALSKRKNVKIEESTLRRSSLSCNVSATHTYQLPIGNSEFFCP